MTRDPLAFQHRPVLLEQVVEHLRVHAGGIYLDGTLGGGGHAEALLDAGARVVGIDRDPDALAAANQRLARFGDRFHALRGRFGELARIADDFGPFDGVLLDVGVSSWQLDNPDRGFSFRLDGPVDMRMDPDQGHSAAELLEKLDEDELTDILYRYGEEPRARRIARAILAGRPWTSTVALAERIASASGYRQSRTHPATRSFQALRIVVNDELGELQRGLDGALSVLRDGGRLAVITFHSLEDRLVKRYFRSLAGVDSPRDAYGNPIPPPTGRLVVRRGLSGARHDADNPRARSARLRVFEVFAAAHAPTGGAPS